MPGPARELIELGIEPSSRGNVQGQRADASDPDPTRPALRLGFGNSSGSVDLFALIVEDGEIALYIRDIGICIVAN